MPGLKPMKSLRKLRRQSSKWISNGTELLSTKLEKLKIACNGYNKMQPIILSRSITTMLPKSILEDDEMTMGVVADDPSLHGQLHREQFYPCLGNSRKVRTNRSKNFPITNIYIIYFDFLCCAEGNTILQSNGKLYVDDVHLELSSNSQNELSAAEDKRRIETTNVVESEVPHWGLCDTCKVSHGIDSANDLLDTGAPVRPGRRKLTRQLTT